MNENDLHEQLARSTAWTEDLTVDPAGDLARGRRRLRRRRATVGAGSAFAVALVATGGSLATAHWGGSTDPAGVAGQVQVERYGPGGKVEIRSDGSYVIQPTPGGPSYTCSSRGQAFTAPGGAPSNTMESNHLDVFASYADPDRRHLVGRETSGVTPTKTGPCGHPGSAGARSDWSEAGGVGWVEITVIPKAVHEQPNDGGIPHPRADTCGLTDDRSTFTACWVTTTADGKQVRVGTRGKQAYWASYVRPDGQLAIATVEGDGRRSDPGTFGGAEPATQNPVAEPSVTLAELIATVTDPSLETAG
ncbi:hypothetical protein BWI15_17775 [Kribbella sp. ALI-6-A]|uniref:hypothetical protein n=1 Tax=Kribbella sp. ALI-6-A TaxID=1933817 RepID=UPI00097BBCB9|nr:hypothetical protein [Kribbella sp. ALI-6-A]ONI71957.1 hypothetical protein BWI15_17775 [Kribbella sp. ALI-6-A]